MESCGTALRLIATMLDTDLARSDRAAAVFAEAGAMRRFVPALATLALSMSRCRVRNALDDVAVVLPAGKCAVPSTCAGYRTLAQHQAGVAPALDAPTEHRPAIRARFERCAEPGLLLSLPELSPHWQLDAASLRASLPTPTRVQTMARDDGRALLAWPQRWSFFRERFA